MAKTANRLKTIILMIFIQIPMIINLFSDQVKNILDQMDFCLLSQKQQIALCQVIDQDQTAFIFYNQYVYNHYYNPEINNSISSDYIRILSILLTMGAYMATPHKDIHINDGQNHSIKYVSGSMQGWRNTMQDTSIHSIDIGDGNCLFAVLDGHGGAQVAKFAAEVLQTSLKCSQHYQKKDYRRAFEHAFLEIDLKLAEYQNNSKLMNMKNLSQQWVNNTQTLNIGMHSGCTVNAVLITPELIIVANAGDSRSMLCKGNNQFIQLSNDHKPTVPAERSRIQSAGGFVQQGRINGNLNISRCLGDLQYKNNRDLAYDEQLVICKPEVREYLRQKSDQFILIGSDGIWERYGEKGQELMKIVRQKLIQTQQIVETVKDILQLCLAEDTSQGTGCDNLTAILIEFKS